MSPVIAGRKLLPKAKPRIGRFQSACAARYFPLPESEMGKLRHYHFLRGSAALLCGGVSKSLRSLRAFSGSRMISGAS